MSLNLKAIITFDKQCQTNVNLMKISDACFEIIGEACKRKLAINQVYFRENIGDELRMNEMCLDISNSYVFCEAEKILRDDYSVPKPTHFERLKNLQGLLEYIFNISIVKEMVIIMNDEGNYDFEEIKCTLSNFASTMKQKLFQKISFAYKCQFVKN